MSRQGRPKACHSDRRRRVEVARRQGRVPAQRPRAQHAQHHRSRAPPQRPTARWPMSSDGSRCARSTWNALARFESSCLIVSRSSVRRLPSSGSSPASPACPSTRSRISSSPHTYTHAPDWPAAIHRACSFRDRLGVGPSTAPELHLDGRGTAARDDADEIRTVHELSRARQPEKLPLAMPDGRAAPEAPASRAHERSATRPPRRTPRGDATTSAPVPAPATSTPRPRRRPLVAKKSEPSPRGRATRLSHCSRVSRAA